MPDPHDIANELTAILGYAGLLRDSSLSTAQREMVLQIELASRRALKLQSPDGMQQIYRHSGLELPNDISFADVEAQQAIVSRGARDAIAHLCDARRHQAGQAIEFTVCSLVPDPGDIYCDACGEVIRCQSVIEIADEGRTITRDGLRWLFKPGYDDRFLHTDESPSGPGYHRAATALHEIGAHITVISRSTSTIFRLYLS